MQYKAIFRSVGLVLLLFSFSMLPPILINMLFKESAAGSFVGGFLLTSMSGALLWILFRHDHAELNIRDGFIIIVFIWILVSSFGALPFILSTELHVSLTDGLFETVSGLTTTGAECFKQIEALPHALLYYHQQLQFLGGLGIVVLAVAIFPLLGTGGMELFQIESSKFQNDSKLTPRVTQTAKSLWGIYSGITILCALAYWYLGMDWFHALGESFGTVSSGGFSMHSSGFMAYQNHYINVIACLFMFTAAINYSLHYMALKQHSLKVYLNNEEFRSFIKLMIGAALLALVLIAINNSFHHNSLSLREIFFMITSLSTNSGFTFYPPDHWPLFIPILVIFISLIGGCTGSTSGGLKILRFLLLSKFARHQFICSLHPQAIINIKLNEKTLENKIVRSIIAFAIVYFATFIMLIFLFMACDNDFISSISLAATGLANASGAGYGSVKSSFADLNNASKWLSMFAMITGRLEIFPLIIIFTRAFWQK